MSDAKLRDLERRWKETGTVEDEAAYLLERVRVGDLTQERLELAATVGHSASRVVVGSSLPAPFSASWFDTLARTPGGVMAAATAVCAALRLRTEPAVDGALERIWTAVASADEAALDTIDSLEHDLFGRTDRPSRRIWNVARAVNVVRSRRAELETQRDATAMIHLKAAIRGLDGPTDVLARAGETAAASLLFAG